MSFSSIFHRDLSGAQQEGFDKDSGKLGEIRIQFPPTLTVRKSESLHHAAEGPVDAHTVGLHSKLIPGVGLQPTDENVFIRAAKRGHIYKDMKLDVLSPTAILIPCQEHCKRLF